jgi:hypothetical protein
VFIERKRSTTTCRDSGTPPASCLATTCLRLGVNACLLHLETTCLPLVPANGLRTEKEHYAMSTTDSRYHISPSSSRSTTRKRRQPDVTEVRSRAQRTRLAPECPADIPWTPARVGVRPCRSLRRSHRHVSLSRRRYFPQQCRGQKRSRWPAGSAGRPHAGLHYR